MQNSYGRYKNVRNASWQTLIDNNICELPINVLEIADNLGIKVLKNSEVHMLNNGEIGISLFINNRWVIFYDDKIKSVGRKRFTIAHELGHIILGHPLINERYARTFDINKPIIEKEADTFATRLLTPACVLHGLGVTSPYEISKICGVSLEMATIRAKRLEELKRRNKFLTSPLEKQVYKQFENYILINK